MAHVTFGPFRCIREEEDLTGREHDQNWSHGYYRADAVQEGSRKEAKRQNRNMTQPELITWLTSRSSRCGTRRKEEGSRRTKQKQYRSGNAHYGAVAVAEGRKEEEQDHSTELAWRRKGRSMTRRLRVNLLPRK